MSIPLAGISRDFEIPKVALTRALPFLWHRSCSTILRPCFQVIARATPTIFGSHFSQVLSAYLNVDLLAWVFVAVVLARVILILRRKVVPSLLWDGLALGGIAYVASYLALRMEAAYYFAPVDLIALLYLGRLAMLYRENMGLGTKLCAVALLTLVLLQDLSLSAFRMYERKNVIHAKAEMGRVIEARYESDPQNAKRLFFPFARPNRVMEFGAYLNYRGVPMERVPDGTIATGNVVMVGQAIRKDGPCVRGKPLVCHAGARPDPGDLIVLLPDDFTRTDELNSYRQDGSPLLFSYHPRPSIPRWLRSVCESSTRGFAGIRTRPAPGSLAECVGKHVEVSSQTSGTQLFAMAAGNSNNVDSFLAEAIERILSHRFSWAAQGIEANRVVQERLTGDKQVHALRRA